MAIVWEPLTDNIPCLGSLCGNFLSLFGFSSQGASGAIYEPLPTTDLQASRRDKFHTNSTSTSYSVRTRQYDSMEDESSGIRSTVSRVTGSGISAMHFSRGSAVGGDVLSI